MLKRSDVIAINTMARARYASHIAECAIRIAWQCRRSKPDLCNDGVDYMALIDRICMDLERTYAKRRTGVRYADYII